MQLIFTHFLCCSFISRPARVIKPRRTEDAPRAAVAARKPVVPASSVQQKPARRDVAKPSGGGAAPKKHSPSVPASGPGARYKGGKKVLYVITYCIHAYCDGCCRSNKVKMEERGQPKVTMRSQSRSTLTHQAMTKHW